MPISSATARDGFYVRTAFAATAGGLASEITGGKFSNGAVTAAFAHLYNHESHYDCMTGRCMPGERGMLEGGEAGGGWTAGQVLGGSIGVWIRSEVEGWFGGTIFNASQPGPNDAPRGTKPIDQWGIDKDNVHEIKDNLGAGPRDWVGITPGGVVITVGPKGEAIDNGHVDDFTNRPLKRFPRSD